MSWQTALVLLFVVTVGLTLLQRHYSQRHRLPESFPPALSYLLGVMPLGLLVGLLGSHHVHWSWWLALLLATEGIFIGLYNWLSFMAIRRLPLARFQTLYQVYELVVIVLGWSLLGEGLSPSQLIGGLLILAAALLAIRAPQTEPQHTKGRRRLGRFLTSAVLLTLGAAITMGIGLVAEKAALRHMDMGAYFIFGYGTQALALLALASKDISRMSIRAIKLYDIRRSLAMGVLSAAMGFLYIFAIVRSDNISLITALSAFSLPLTVFAAYVFLREREHLKLILSSVALGFAGLIISALHF